jgi:hypothetical protein
MEDDIALARRTMSKQCSGSQTLIWDRLRVC